ncbi:MAG: hypothetical protein NDI81_21125 [Desulfobacula sp.]|nr:hypothetical protein [Desulfobacula sp.]
MTILFPVLLIIAGAVCIPAYIASRRNGNESKWFLFISLPAFVFWLGLTGIGYGAQSLSNVVELLWVLVIAVVLSYLKVFLVDRKLRKPKQTTFIMMALLVIGAFLLRTFMPILPE